MQVDANTGAEGERQFREHPCRPRTSNVMSRQQVPCLVFPDRSSCPTGEPAPTQRFAWFHVAAREGRQRLPQPRRSGGRPVGDQRREPVEEQVHGTWICCRGCGKSRGGHLPGVDVARKATGVQRRGQRIEVRLARLRHVQRLEPARRGEQQGRCVAAALGGKGDPRAKDVCLGPLELVEPAGLGMLDQHKGVVDRTRLVLRLCRCQRPARAFRWLDRQRGRTFEECPGRGEPRACLGTRGRTFQVRGDVFVRHDRCLRSVPGAAIRVGTHIRRYGESPMDLDPLNRAGGPIYGRANERMPEGNAWPECDQTARLRRHGRRLRDPEKFGGPPDERRVPRGFARGDEDQETRVMGKGSHSAPEALLDPAVHRRRRRHPEAAGQL